MTELERDLKLLIRARYPLLYLVSYEEERVEKLLRSVTHGLSSSFYGWSHAEGLRLIQESEAKSGATRESDSALDRSNSRPDAASTRAPGEVLDYVARSASRTLFMLRDFHHHLEDPRVVRQLRDLLPGLRSSFKSIVLTAPLLKFPTELEKDLTVVDVPLPTQEELAQQLRAFAQQLATDQRFTVELDAGTVESFAMAARGLTEVQARRVFGRVAVEDARFDSADLEQILEEKKQEIRKLGVLDYREHDERLSDVGGLDGLKRWLHHRRDVFTVRAREYGLPQPKGVLLLGVQGCGKSLAAKAIASTLGLPLLRLDVGQVFSSYIGQSEENMRLTTRTAEALAPVVLWIDEIEKGFAGTKGSGSADSGATMRVFATFLTWLQEKTDPVFVVATANQVQELPPELLRKGRFDEIFFVDLPRDDERAEIFSIHVARRDRDPGTFDLEELARLAAGFSGAEIEQAVIAGMFRGFSQDREFTTADIAEALAETVPLSRTMDEDITALRQWARSRARPASSPQ